MLADNETILERVERELERNSRKRLYSDKKTGRVKRQKTNVLNQSESSEDEIEQLRMQVQED